jgi:hypothetical protein
MLWEVFAWCAVNDRNAQNLLFASWVSDGRKADLMSSSDA